MWRFLARWYALPLGWRRGLLIGGLIGGGLLIYWLVRPAHCVDTYRFSEVLDEAANRIGAELVPPRYDIDETKYRWDEAEERGGIKPDSTGGSWGYTSVIGGSMWVVRRGAEVLACTMVTRERGVCYVDLVGSESLGEAFREELLASYPKLKIGVVAEEVRKL